jgi:histidinol-phosphatase (PHP family)
MAAMARAAHAAGLAGVAFTDHVEWMPGDEATGILKSPAYFAELDELRARYNGEMQLLAGVEVGDSHRFPAETREIVSAWPWDYILGSIHWVDGQPGWEPEMFESGVAVAYARYFDELIALAQGGEYDVLAHFDLVRRDSWAVCRQVLPVEPYAEAIREALRAVVARGKGLEINTSAWSAGLDEPCPGLTILRWYRELGGEVLVFGSDAHRPERVGADFDRARDLALVVGFTRLARFERRRIVGWDALE